jgi:hypothetical protein
VAGLGAGVGRRRGGGGLTLGRPAGLALPFSARRRLFLRLIVAAPGEQHGGEQQDARLHGRRPYESAAIQ